MFKKIKNLSQDKIDFANKICDMYMFGNAVLTSDMKRAIKSLLYCLDNISKDDKIEIYVKDIYLPVYTISFKNNKFKINKISKDTKLEICNYFKKKVFHKIAIVNSKNQKNIVYEKLLGLDIGKFSKKYEKNIIFPPNEIKFGHKKINYYINYIVPYIIENTKQQYKYKVIKYHEFYCLANDGIFDFTKYYTKMGNKNYFENNPITQTRNLSFMFSRDEKYLFVSTEFPNEINMLNRETDEILKIPTFRDDNTLFMNLLDLYNDGETLVYSCSLFEKTYIFNYKTEKLIKSIDGYFQKGIFSPDFQFLVLFNYKLEKILTINCSDFNIINQQNNFPFDDVGVNSKNVIQIFRNGQILQFRFEDNGIINIPSINIENNNYKFFMVVYSKDKNFCLILINYTFYLLNFNNDKVTNIHYIFQKADLAYFDNTKYELTYEDFYYVNSSHNNRKKYKNDTEKDLFHSVPFLFSQKNNYILFFKNNKDIIKIDIKEHIYNDKKDTFVLGLGLETQNESKENNPLKNFKNDYLFDENLIYEIFDYVN